MTNQVLNEGDLLSPVWAKLRRHYEDKLQRLRKKNDDDHDVLKTAKLRGEIAEIKRFLALGVIDQTQIDE